MGSLNNEFYMPHSSILLNHKIYSWRHDDFRISVWQAAPQFQELAGYSAENLPYVSHTKQLKSIFVLGMNRTENNVQIPHFMLD